jgi:hypothetical protein
MDNKLCFAVHDFIHPSLQMIHSTIELANLRRYLLSEDMAAWTEERMILPSGTAVDRVPLFFKMPCKWQCSNNLVLWGFSWQYRVVSVPSIPELIPWSSLLY